MGYWGICLPTVAHKNIPLYVTAFGQFVIDMAVLYIIITTPGMTKYGLTARQILRCRKLITLIKWFVNDVLSIVSASN